MSFFARLAFLAAATLFTALPLRAAEIAALSIIGFSDDGQYFAFEEFGVEDGSGFPYSNIFVVNIGTDSFAEGTPVRVRIDEEVPLASARKASTAKAAPILDRLGLGNDPGHLLVFNPVTEFGSDPHKVSFYGYASNMPFGDVNTLELTQTAAPMPDKCKDFGETPVGFRLTATSGADNPPQIVHEDVKLPDSRNCPIGYRIAAVVSSDTAIETRIALVQYNYFAFEGSDGRFIAIPLKSAKAMK